jgi:hypothetical protein
MESQLLERIYTPRPVLSMHRTECTNVSALEFMHIYTRFQLGRATAQDRQWFVWDSGMTPEAFHDKNNFNLVEPVYEVATKMAADISAVLS